ncbi:MAG: GMC family oxidoreductase, partial [Pseudoclavibacter sp.]
TPTTHVLGRSLDVPRGRVLGGSSSTNAMLWYRGARADYDAWASSGATGWGFDDLLPYFRRSEARHEGDPAYRGVEGPMRVAPLDRVHPIADALVDSASERGLPVLDDANAASNEGAVYADYNAITGIDQVTGEPVFERWSAARAYLEPALDRPNLHVLVDSRVHRVALGRGPDGAGRAVGVTHVVEANADAREGRDATASRAARTARLITTRADRIVLTAGAIDTPRILQLSGIGDADRLAAAGIVPAHALPGVGENLQDHPLILGVNFRASHDLGPAIGNGGGSMVNWRSSLATTGPDLHTVIAHGSRGDAVLHAAHDLGGNRVFSLVPGLYGSRSTGWVRVRAEDPDAHADVQPNYLADPADLAAIVEALDGVLELAASPAFADLVDGQVTPPPGLDRAAKVRFVRQNIGSFFHCAGTSRMGVDERAVVDPQLRVRGLDGLWVADASVMPTIPTCNTQAPTIAIAERAADLLRAAP